jgi:hypothetical protein
VLRVVCVGLVLLCPGLAVAGPPKDLIPPGEAWFCTPVAGIRICFRTEADCNEMADDEDCVRQPNASALTFFHVMQEKWKALTFASTQACGMFRKAALKDADLKSVSGCQLVGEKLPPPAKLDTNVIPGGTSWFCTPGAGPCFRDEDECRGWAPGLTYTCTKHARVWLYTSTEPLVGMPTAYRLRTQKDCETHRRKGIFSQDAVSSCTSVGATAVLNEPKGWFCYEGSKEPGHCLRTKADCEARRAFDVRMKYEPRECAARDTASAFVNAGELEAYPTSDECFAAAAKVKMLCTSVE